MRRNPVDQSRSLSSAGHSQTVIGTALLPKLTVPRLVLYSGNNADRYQWDLDLPHPAGDEIELWPDNGHFLHQEAPERFEGRVRDWLTARDFG